MQRGSLLDLHYDIYQVCGHVLTYGDWKQVSDVVTATYLHLKTPPRDCDLLCIWGKTQSVLKQLRTLIYVYIYVRKTC